MAHDNLKVVAARTGLVNPNTSMLFAICFICAREWRRALPLYGRSGDDIDCFNHQRAKRFVHALF